MKPEGPSQGDQIGRNAQRVIVYFGQVFENDQKYRLPIFLGYFSPQLRLCNNFEKIPRLGNLLGHFFTNSLIEV
jgi:hypothetical protein